ncbi:hypothetical protein ACFQJC_14355 [Haloferax namakaokahaiae]|uniref:Uncharacterized protein n=1 Tax=Haloferax namakaokahaiae TaxID=1748331 RepID=A0ABD5ZII1_9EURY
MNRLQVALADGAVGFLVAFVVGSITGGWKSGLRAGIVGGLLSAALTWVVFGVVEADTIANETTIDEERVTVGWSD